MAFTNQHQTSRDKFIQDLIDNDPNVAKAWDEGSDGIWIDLVPGLLASATMTHTVHEWTITDCRESLRNLEPCPGEAACECPAWKGETNDGI